jgi:hypothetical protein
MHRCLQVNGTVNEIYHYQLYTFHTDKRLLFTQRSNVQPVISIMKERKKITNNVRKKKAIKSILCIVFNQT